MVERSAVSKRAFLGILLVSTVQCGRAPAPAPRAPTRASASATACGDVVGAWSSVVNGLRGRLVTSGSRRDRLALRVVIELENDSGSLLEIDWTGRIHVGFATFHLEDEHRKEVPEPGWQFGGNEAASGQLRTPLAPTGVAQRVVGDKVLLPFNGGRAIRIGAFWGRDMPTDGSRRFLRATVRGGPLLPDALAYEGDSFVEKAPRGRAWVGALELPAVCIR